MGRMDIYSAFKSIWEIIGTQKFKETSNIDNIDFFYETRMNSLKEIASYHLINLKDFWPEFEFSEKTKKLKEKYS